MAERPLEVDDIRSHLLEVADELVSGERHTLVLVGGALLAFHQLRSTTADVDTVRRVPEALQRAALAVAIRTTCLRHGSTTRPARSDRRPSTTPTATSSSTIHGCACSVHRSDRSSS